MLKTTDFEQYKQLLKIIADEVNVHYISFGTITHEGVKKEVAYSAELNKFLLK